jgi:hypothetical protein
LVNKDAVQANEGWGESFIGPGITTVPEGKLDQPQGVNAVIKQLSLMKRQIVVVAVRGVVGDVKVSGKNPRGVV